MQSCIKNVEILIKLLKQYEIQDVVLSPGGSDIPIIHSLETNEYFNCYSVVDERNNTYFALGLAQEKNKPVASICTSGTAVCNFLPGVTEAFYQNVPLVVITADKNPDFQSQLETQKIVQTNMFQDVVKKSVNLPIIKDESDCWVCNRLINESLLELTHHNRGPVQINIPIIGDTGSFVQNDNCLERKMERFDNLDDDNLWRNFAKELYNKKIMVVVGQNIIFTDNQKKNMEVFFEKTNSFYAIEHLSNLRCKGTINTYPITEMGVLNESYLPDIVLSIGNNLSSYNLKTFLRKYYKSIDNWFIDSSGMVRDTYKSLKKIIECDSSTFFERVVKYLEDEENHSYFEKWSSLNDLLEINNNQYFNTYIAKKIAETIPDNSVLHLAILNSTRIMQFYNLPQNVKVYSNVGALGIDGCLATFAGQAAASDKKSYLLIGDLSFFYGMNGAALKSIANNVRIILINNSGGSEFHFFMGKERIPSINDYICAQHNRVAEGWIKSLEYDYYSAKTVEEVDKVLEIAKNDSDKPIFIEVFTDMENDARLTKEIYSRTKYNFGKNIGGVEGAKEMLKSKLSEGQKEKIREISKILKN